MAITFSSCAASLQSGGWIAPLLPLIGASYFGRKWAKDDSDSNKYATLFFLAAFVVILLIMWAQR